MPIQIYRRQNNPEDSIAQAILAGTQGFVQGRQLKRQNEQNALANAYRAAQIAELQRKSQAYRAQARPGYFVDPISGKQTIDRSPEAQGAVAREKARAQFDAFSGLFGSSQVVPIPRGGSDNYPPGTTMRLGPLNIPLNPKLTGEEASAVAAQEVFPPLAKALKQKTREGIFKSPLGNIGRTYRQIAAGQPNALLTAYDPNLQSVQGKINSLRRYVFGEGGKQLTPYEANIVNALINPKGKSDAQYETDLDEATKLIESKSKLALGGANVARSGGLPKRQKTGGQIMTDASGNKAMVYPDGSFEEI